MIIYFLCYFLFAQTGEQHSRYQQLIRNCRNVDGRVDVAHLVKSLDLPNPPRPLYRFSPPQMPQQQEADDGHIITQVCARQHAGMCTAVCRYAHGSL